MKNVSTKNNRRRYKYQIPRFFFFSVETLSFTFQRSTEVAKRVET